MTRCTRAASPAEIASSTVVASKRATSATPCSIDACEISPAGQSKANLSISCLAARRFPSSRSASTSSASGDADWPCRARRVLNQAGRRSRSTGLDSIITAASNKARNHFAFWPCQSISGRVINVTVSGGSLEQYDSIAGPPSRPGLPLGIRNSTRRREAKSDISFDAARNVVQSKPGSAMKTTRSV